MNVPAYKTRYVYHLRWAAKYWLACTICMALSLFAWPSRAGIVAVVVGYGFAWLGRRERRRAHQVQP
jgi:hypothetical protein